MPRVVITHSVEDVERWLEGKSERAEQIGAIGGANVVDHVAKDGSKTIAVTLDADDVAVLMETIAAPPPGLLAAMQRHGVIPPLTVFVEK